MNNVSLMGRLTKDIELATTQSGVKKCTFTVAVRRKFKNNDGEYESDFIRCVAWRKTAEFIAKYFSKGQQIGIAGTIQTRSWEQDGQMHSITEVVAESAEFVESKKQNGVAEQAVKRDVPDGFSEAPPSEEDLPF